MTKWETQDSLVLSMHIYYKELNLRLVHYTVTNQDKGSTALVRATFFNVWGSQICLIKKKMSKSKAYSGFWLTFFDILT